MDSKKIGQFIATQRKQLSMTQQDLANQLNMTNRAISKWETGEGYPDITVLPALAKIFDVTVDELLAAKKNPDNAGGMKKKPSQSELLTRHVAHFSNHYLICMGIMLLGIVLSILSFKLYNGVWISLSYSLLISAFFLIIIMMFYINISKKFNENIQQYTNIAEDTQRSINKAVNKKHMLFYIVYCIHAAIFVCAIPLLPFVSLGYYRVFHTLFGYNSIGRFVLDFHFYIIICLLVYGVLLITGAFIIKKTFRYRKRQP